MDFIRAYVLMTRSSFDKVMYDMIIDNYQQFFFLSAWGGLSRRELSCYYRVYFDRKSNVILSQKISRETNGNDDLPVRSYRMHREKKENILLLLLLFLMLSSMMMMITSERYPIDRYIA